MLENLESSMSSSEHFRFLWYPHTGYVNSYHVSRTSKVFEVLKACYIMVSIHWILNEGLRACSCYKQTVFWVELCNVVTHYMYVPNLWLKMSSCKLWWVSLPFCVWTENGDPMVWTQNLREISNSISSNLATLLKIVG